MQISFEDDVDKTSQFHFQKCECTDRQLRDAMSTKNLVSHTNAQFS